VVVPPDAVAPIDAELRDTASTMMHKNMNADIVAAARCVDGRGPTRCPKSFGRRR
jgi:hypothetical protein